MLNDEITPEVELDDNQIDEVEETTDEEVETTTQETDSENDEVDWKAEALKWQAIAKRKAKQTVSQKVTQPVQKQNLQDNYLTREEGILIAKGMTEENLNQLKVIAKGKDISLLEAEKDPLFTTYFEKFQKEKKSEQAKLGASKGSSYKETKPEFKNGMTREEHFALWKENN